MPTSSDHHFDLAVRVAIEAIKALLLVNSGAAAAFIALSGKVGTAPDYTRAILAFGVGSFAAVAAFVCGYFSQLAYANHRLAGEQGDSPKSTFEHARHLRRQHVAIFFVAVSLVAGFLGMALAWCAAR